MRSGGMAALVLGLAALGMMAPFAAMADHDRDTPHTIITIVCTIYSDMEAITGVDLALGLSLGQLMANCEMTAEAVETVVPTASVAVTEGSLFPECADTDDCFAPHTITVEPGTAVTWTNNDNVLHTITETEPEPLFDGWALPGEEFTFTFDSPGTYMYGCTVHPWASGVVIVGSGTAPQSTDEPAAVDEPAVMDEPDDNPQLAYDLVDSLIALYMEEGEGALDTINAMVSDTDQPVVGFVVDIETYTIVAHSENPAFLGFPVEPLLENASIPIEVMLQIITEEDEGVWLSYPLPDPQGNIIGYERGWMKMHDGYVFVARYSVDVEERVQGIVQEMIRFYDRNPETTFDTIDSFMSQDPSYPFVTNIETRTIAAHGADPDRVGTTSTILTNSSVPLEDFLAMEEGDATWVDYVFTNPATGMEQSKRSWVVVHDGHLFGAGYYP